MKVYSGVNTLPTGRADNSVQPGCLVLEGGAWRGLYTQGALDALMQAGINFDTTVGVSAGAMSGVGYLSGQIGWAPRLNLTYRHDSRYCGIRAMLRDHGITGFSYLFRDLIRKFPLDKKRLMRPDRRFYVVATNLFTGKPGYFSKDRCDILRAVQASATVPFLSRPVVINRIPWLDGGCSVKIPYLWAKKNHFQKIMIIRTRERSYRSSGKEHTLMNRIFYRRYPEFCHVMNESKVRYNVLLDTIDAEEKAGRVHVLAPSRPVDVSRFEKDMEKLGALYWLGYHDMQKDLPRLKEYLAE